MLLILTADSIWIFDCITPVTQQLHWLIGRQREKFKTTFLFSSACALRGLAPVYLVNYCKPTSVNTGCFLMRSANLCQLSVPRTSTSYEDKSFVVCRPSTWNSLPAALWSTGVSVETFRTQLKTFLFNYLDSLYTVDTSAGSVAHLWPLGNPVLYKCPQHCGV